MFEGKLRQAHGLLLPFARSDVTGHDHGANDGAGRVANWTETATADPGDSGVFAAEGILGIGDGFAPERPRDRPHIQRDEFAGEQEFLKNGVVVVRLAGTLGYVLKLVEGGESIIKFQGFALGIRDENGIRHAGQGGIHPCPRLSARLRPV